ncbi:MAG: hypothetical protein IT289_07820 [Oligoflexia bacterium]|nr:hypothetical protein [Oligoflexia bacterium]
MLNFGMVSNQTRCVLCHMNVYGDVAATEQTPFSLHENSVSTIYGNVLANQTIIRQTYNVVTGLFSNTVSDPQHHLLERLLPPDPNPYVRVSVFKGPGVPFKIVDGLMNTSSPLSFPSFKINKIRNLVSGKIRVANAVKVNKIFNGSLILDGRSQVITLEGEVLIDGDLIIHGRFNGIGTIYVSGNIYIPDDIVVENNSTLFAAYRSNVLTADTKARQAIQNNENALRLATGKHIVIGDPGVLPVSANPLTVPFPPDTRLRNYIANRDNSNYVYNSYYGFSLNQVITSESADIVNGTWVPILRSRMEASSNFLRGQESFGFISEAQRRGVFDLDPNYIARLKPEYDLPVKVCNTDKNFRVGFGAVARIDAALYAQQSIGGVVHGGGNIVLNGGVFTQHLGVLGATAPDLEWIYGDPSGNGNRRVLKIYEMKKQCSDIVAGGVGEFLLSDNIVNPYSGVRIGESAITYDYRLRNNGPGFDIMRRLDY